MDNIITSFRRESTAFAMESGKHHLSNNSIGAPSDAEYAKAAAVWFPELEIFEFVRSILILFAKGMQRT